MKQTSSPEIRHPGPRRPRPHREHRRRKPLGEVIDGQLPLPAGRSKLPDEWRGQLRRRSASIQLPTANRASGCRCRALADIKHRRGAVDHHPRVGPAADRRHRQRPRPRPGPVRRRGAGAKVKADVALPPGRYTRRVRRAVRATPTRADAAADRRALVALVMISCSCYATYGNGQSTRCGCSTGVPFAGSAASSPCGCGTCRSRSRPAIGFIALSGVAVLDDMILVSYVRQLRQKRGMSLERRGRARPRSRGCGPC